MSGARNKLNRTIVKGLNEPGRYNDGGGLYLFVRKSGVKSWVYRYQVNGRSRDMGLGAMSKLNDIGVARKLADEARMLVKSGIDPLEKRDKDKAIEKKEKSKSKNFGELLEEFFTAKDRTGFFRTQQTRRKWFYCLSHHASGLHDLPISAIETRDVYSVLEPIWMTKTETASRTRLYIEAVLAWAKTMGLRSDPNPATWRGNLDQLLTPKSRVRPTVNLPGIAWQEIPKFMSELKSLEWPSARLLEFIIYTASRSGEARGALWEEIDLDRMVWEIPAARMKMKRPHLVPLNGRVLELVRLASKYKTSPLIFPNPKSNKEFSYNAPRVTLRKLNQNDVTTHGFRSSFKTWALEATNFPTQAIEFALAHETKNAVEGAYIRGNRMLEKRREVMIAWDAFCNGTQLQL